MCAAPVVPFYLRSKGVYRKVVAPDFAAPSARENALLEGRFIVDTWSMSWRCEQDNYFDITDQQSI
jgi:hypothetical protein